MFTFLSQLVVLPAQLCCCDVILLTLFGAAAQQDHQLRAVFAEVNAIAFAKVDLQFENARANAFGIRCIAKR